MNDEQLRETLEQWKAPEPGQSLDARVLAAYRERVKPPLWRRLLRARISVPVPVAAAIVLAIIIAAIVLAPPRQRPAYSSPRDTAAAHPVQQVRIEDFRPVANPEMRVVR